jgi:hypothetical protein
MSGLWYSLGAVAASQQHLGTVPLELSTIVALPGSGCSGGAAAAAGQLTLVLKKVAGTRELRVWEETSAARCCQ